MRVTLPILLLAASQTLSAQQPKVVPIQVTGDAASRFSLVILGDGYTAAELPRFREHVDKHLNIMWSLEPFRSYRNYINVYTVEVVSQQSGITCDPAHREQRTTPLGMQFGGGCTNPNARGITVSNPEAVRGFARLATPDLDQILVIANTDTYGGIGGQLATTSGGNALGPYITPHELGHSLGRLADEYTYSARGREGGVYAGAEPNDIHHTLLTEEQMRSQQAKWFRWLGEPSESGGLIGRFSGGKQMTSGVWRPSKHSMMISLGYYFDQVSRERMTQKISGNVKLIAASTPADAPVGANEVIWIETAHPNFHELNVTWQVDGQPVANANNSVNLALGSLKLGAVEHTVTVKVVDPTHFVRDPAVRDTSFTATRSWKVGPARAAGAAVQPVFTSSTQTARAVSGQEVVYVETAHPSAHVLNVAWRVDGRAVANPNNSRSLNLAQLNLSAGRHTLSATVTDPNNTRAQGQTLNWTVDAIGPTVKPTLAVPVATITRPDGAPHFFMRDQFTMKLEPTDDQPGYVVAEFRVNGDGWHHYYGWPDAPAGTPFLFTPRGTTIKELVYGSLSSEGLSPQPWEPREPGWGTHRVEYRARDAAGNIGAAQEFRVTFQAAPECTATVTGQHRGDLAITSGVTCLNDATVSGGVTVSNGASLVAARGTIRGSLTATGASAVELAGTTVEGAVQITGTTTRLILFGSTLNRDVTLASNRTPAAPTLAGNRFGSALNITCDSTSPDNLGLPNTVRGRGPSECATR